MNVIDERIAQEKNEIRKTYISNPHGLTPYKFRKLIRENDLQEVSVRGNGYCFIFCIIITLAELGINKTLEVLSVEVMAHIRQHKEDFYSNFQVLSKSEDEVENLIECCAKYFEGGACFTNSADICIPAIATTLGVNLNLFQKDPTTICSCIIILALSTGKVWMHTTTVTLTHSITSKMLLPFLQGWSGP